MHPDLAGWLSGGCARMQVITRTDEQGHKLEPYEEAVVEVPESHMGGVVDLMGSRKGQMLDMAASTEGLNRVTYRIPTRGLLGLRNAILTATKVEPAAGWPTPPCFTLDALSVLLLSPANIF